MHKKRNVFFRRLLLWVLVCALFINAVPVYAEEENSSSVCELYTAPHAASAVCGSFSVGDSVTLLDTVSPLWNRVRLNDGTTGYCDAALLGKMFLDSETEAERPIGAVRTRTAAIVFQSPDADSEPLARLPANALVTVLAEGVDGFCMVQLQNRKMGYIEEDALQHQYEQPALIRTVPEFSSAGAVTEEEAAARLQELSAYFQHGFYWNCIGTGQRQSKDNLFLITETPCHHPSQGYSYCNIYTGTLCNAYPEYSTAMQCFGYVNLLSDLVFGTEAPVSSHGSFDRIRVGDHVRLVLWDHSMLVTKVCKDENGETYFYATDVNADYDSCRIQWGRKFTKQELRRLGDYVLVQTRYPTEP